jgi:hypothetical protein
MGAGAFQFLSSAHSRDAAGPRSAAAGTEARLERRRTAREDPRSAVARAITHVPEDRESHAGTITAART